MLLLLSNPGAEDFPKAGRTCTILVDKAHDALLLPLFGTLVPFHISTVKSVVKSDEGHKAFLRINFYSAAQVSLRRT